MFSPCLRGLHPCRVGLGAILLLWFFAGVDLSAAPVLIPTGVARQEITPQDPVPLMGYASRAQLPASTQTVQRIYARALAIGADPEAAVVITIDNCILPGAITTEIRERLSKRLRIQPERIALTVTHTHSAPCLTGAAPNIFGRTITPSEQSQIDAYTRYFSDRLEAVAMAALQDRRPSRLAWGRGSVGFAQNRRTAGGPVDHDLPLLRVSRPDGSLRAVWVSYACHCTTLSGDLNAVHGDWAGVAALAFERDHPDSIALVSIGAGADSNPDPRGTIELVNHHGESLALEASRLVALPLVELTQSPVCRLATLQLPYQSHFTRAQWETRATQSGIIGHHARRWLERLDSGQILSPTLPYPVQTWAFGSELAMVFLGGEVVVDYSLRLKRELDFNRLWVNAYANDVPCYIPSRRILKEGGYEAETSLWYYDRPQQLSPDIEDQIVGAVVGQLPPSFRADPRQLDFPPPKSPEAALLALRPASGFQVELAVSEPLIESPVAIDFGPDGRLWVCEMRDYPSGMDGSGKPGGRVKVLTDSRGKGRFDRAEVVADGLPFPTGVMAWGDGVLVCAAPDVWWFRPVSGVWQGRRLLSGFATHNFQARVNGLRWGMDGWIYGSGGLFGGTITVPATGQVVDCRNRDFRFRPETGEFEALAGVSQQGRVWDDFGNAFGNDNSTLIWHFPLPDFYTRANALVTPPAARIILSGNGDVGQVFPASRTLARFNDPDQANRLTSACGPEIYRDTLLGADSAGDLFVCEPVHNLVRRAQLLADGISFRSRRTAGENRSEFLASTDNWFRPVEVRTGPDGALWVVDFNRFVIEHPRWIPSDRLKELDVRAGAGTGRLWRVLPMSSRAARPIRDLTRLSPVALAAVMESPNGVERDLAQRLLLKVPDSQGVVRQRLEKVTREASAPASRAQTVALLAGRNELSEATATRAWKDVDPRVRQVTLRALQGQPIAAAVLRVGPVPLDAPTLFQYLLTASVQAEGDAGVIFRSMNVPLHDPWLRTAWLLAARRNPWEAFQSLDRLGPLSPRESRPEVVSALLSMMAADGYVDQLTRVFTRLVPEDSRAIPMEETWAALRCWAVLRQHPDVLRSLESDATSMAAVAVRRLRDRVFPQLLHHLENQAFEKLPEGTFPVLLELLSISAQFQEDHRRLLLSLLDLDLPAADHTAVVRALQGLSQDSMAEELLRGWSRRSPRSRQERITLLMGRESWSGVLVKALRQGSVLPAEVVPAYRQRLRQHARDEIRLQAEELFPEMTSERSEVVSRFQDVNPLLGDPQRGMATFDRLCASCHQLGGHGHAVGPDLAPFRSKPVADYLNAILDPNAAIDPRYMAWTTELRDGRVLTGVLRDETSSVLTWVEPGGLVTTLKRSEIQKMVPASRSLMPEGLEAGMTSQQLADLIAWIQSGASASGR